MEEAEVAHQMSRPMRPAGNLESFSVQSSLLHLDEEYAYHRPVACWVEVHQR